VGLPTCRGGTARGCAGLSRCRRRYRRHDSHERRHGVSSSRMSLEVGGVVELGAVGAAWVERGAEKEGVAAAETDDAARPACRLLSSSCCSS